MATYTGTPRTWVTSETVTAALMNSDIRDPLAALSGAWNSYSPTLSGWAIGNGTISAYYIQVGKLVIFRAAITFGSTSTFTGSPTLTLPVTAAGSGQFAGRGIAVDASDSSAFYDVIWANSSTTAMSFYYPNTSPAGKYTQLTSSTPFSWTTSDSLRGGGVYEAA